MGPRKLYDRCTPVASSLGFHLFCAIGAFLFQISGLLGTNGILPIQDFLSHIRHHYPKQRYFYVPSLFWIRSDNRALIGLTAVGTFLSILLMIGIAPPLLLALLFVIYLSIVSVGQDFLSFGWESFLLEITFYAFFVALTPVPNVMMWICLNFLLFRFHVQAGASKLQSHDRSWRDLTALWYHYQSQPLPNTWAWYVHKLPINFHRASTLFMFLVELVVPFGLFLTDDIRAGVGLVFIGLQVIIWLTGNFSYLNHMTIALSIIAFSNCYLSFLSLPPETSTPSYALTFLLTTLGTLFFILQVIRLWTHFTPHPLAKYLQWLSPFHLVNRYGLFAIMTKERIEIVVEGSNDGVKWEEYLCKHKPSEVTRRPRRISPFQPRLDWQMWFLPFDDFEGENWFQLFLVHLLKGTPDVLKLLRHNPFPDDPPRYIRAVMYDYKFSSSEQKKNQGWWWQREFVGYYSPVLSLRSTEEKS